MTTTLRPVGPERIASDGARARDFEVCVNGRAAGRIELGTDHRFGPAVGRVRALTVDEPDRRRGRGTVAALAGEEVLRGWGCERIEVSVPAAATAARGLFAALGYVERNRNLAKDVEGAANGERATNVEHAANAAERPAGEPLALPAGSTVRPMREAEYGPWLENARRAYASTWAERGVPEEQARALSEADHAELLPDGLRTEGAVLRVLVHEGADVGSLWLSLAPPPGAMVDAYVFDVRVAPEHRGRGHGRTLMRVAEDVCRAAGAARLGLNVFADNTPALRLYESLGYEPVRHHLWKPLI
ncbi:GNAT family N-acetyltransferase [Streptomyces sp. URMC 123]|uniref:GNAT family N-acetyltransferase n=1 Tax=Streptomyces sp. URMC 123 TaxID=3423403 RepID=UPI003F1DBE0A